MENSQPHHWQAYLPADMRAAHADLANVEARLHEAIHAYKRSEQSLASFIAARRSTVRVTSFVDVLNETRLEAELLGFLNAGQLF